MRGVPNPELKAKCIRLRVEERLSLREIHDATGAAKGSLSTWLKDHPLTDEEKTARLAQNRYRTPKKERGTESEYHRMVQRQRLSRHRKAKIAEAAVLFRLVLHGFAAFGSMFDGEKTDWLVEVPDSDHVVKVQVKWVLKAHQGLPTVPLRCTEGHNKARRYIKGEFDILVGYDLYTDTAYVWSWEEVAHLSTSVTICPKAAERWDKLR